MALKIFLLLSLSLLLISSADSAFSVSKELLGGLVKFKKGADFVKEVLDTLKKEADKKDAASKAAKLVRNGGFEELKDSTSPSEWTSKGVELVDAKQLKFINYKTFPFGNYAVELVAGRNSSLSQDIKLIPYKEYKLFFVIGDAKNGCHGNMIVEAAAAGHKKSFEFKSDGLGHAKQAGFSFRAVGFKTQISFTSSSIHKKINDGTFCGPIIDTVIVYS